MLYDAFISHASEDKDSFVRPLAELLREKRVEVWYDEFTLKPGMSLRRSIDHGLSKSRFGIVVLSPHFFGKAWPEWELNGLVQKHLAGTHNVLLPIWHDVTKQTVAAYSPPLADIVAIQSSRGLSRVVDELLSVVQPEESALVVARNLILQRGFEPPVISDDWWLDVIEGAGDQHDYRWCFPIWRMTEESARRGEQLAWIVMQHLWQREVEDRAVSQMTAPEEVIALIESQPGLLEVCQEMPRMLLEFAPQLAVPGFGGPLEEPIETAFQASLDEHKRRRDRQDTSGSALTTNGLCPACDEEFALRHPTFGDYRPSSVAGAYVYASPMGPTTDAYPTIDYVIWLLSTRSDWLPGQHKAFLLQGMKEWAVWPWFGESSDSEYKNSNAGALSELLHDSANKRRFRLTPSAEEDLRGRIEHSRRILDLPETESELTQRFVSEKIIEACLDARSRRKRKRS